jgi:hypothetical protein
MAAEDDIKQAIGCLSTIFPQFVAKELATLTDNILSAVQGFTDPLAAIGDLNLDTIINDVAELSEGDVFDNLGEAAAGLLSQYVRREADSALQAMSEEFPGATKRVQEIRNMSGKIVNTGMLMLSLFNDMPYAAAQRMCQMINRLTDLKIANLTCLKRHIVQLVNTVLVLVENTENYKDDTFEDLTNAANKLAIAQVELVRSRRLSGTMVTFDSQAFERARQAMLEASNYLTPDKDGTSILDVAYILTSGSVESGQVNASNRALTTLVIPSLMHMIELEVAAVVSQVNVINHYIQALGAVIDNFANAANTSRVAEQRDRAILDIQLRVDNMVERINQVLANSSLAAASVEMLLWSSRAKTIIAMMNRVKELTFQVGSIEGPDKAYAVEQAFQKLLLDLTSINNAKASTVAGIEDPTVLRTNVLAIVSASKRVMRDLEAGIATKNKLATLHALAIQTASSQVSVIENSITVAQQQQTACNTFLEIDLQVSEQFNQLTDSMRQLGLDRGVDLLTTGKFEEFLDSDLDTLSYLGVAIECLTESLNGIDDTQTRQQITSIRDDLIGRRTNLDVAAADSSDQGRSRFITRVQEDIASIQKNAKTVESIVDELTVLAENIGANLEDAGEGFVAFLGNLDQLAIGAGGRLAEGLEQFSDHPNAGVPLCEPL